MNEIVINPANFALLTAFLNGLGKAIKEVPWLKNHWIPFVLWVAGGAAHGFLSGWTAPNVLVGIVAATTAGGIHQSVKMAKNIVTGEEPPKA